jgi:hypothetical protein
MNSDRTLTIQKIRELVDEYHNGSHPLPTLIELRREIAVYAFRLSAHIKDIYIKKGYNNAARKWQFASEIVAARDRDIKAGGKPKAMNAIEVEVESLNHVLQAKKAEVEAEAEYEEVKVTIDLAKQVLSALQQEIADQRHEQSNAQFQNTH